MTNTEISSLFLARGLAHLGTVSPDVTQDGERFLKWLESGRHAGMRFLERNIRVRLNPTELLSGTQSALVFAFPTSLPSGSAPQVAAYALTRDYHRVMRASASEVIQDLQQHLPDEQFRICIDTAPLLERALAAKTSHGFIGKNTLYIHPQWGSFFMLGVILTTAPLETTERVDPIPVDRKTREGGCGPCRQCQTHCPTGALQVDYQLDARRCLAYWTIEHRGAIPQEFWPHLSRHWYGCDICQRMCPYNHGERVLPVKRPNPQPMPDLFSVACMDQSQYEKYFGGTALTRAGRLGLRRNALIALAVTSDPRLEEAVAAADTDGGSPLTETVAQIRAGDWLRRSVVTLRSM